MHKREIRQLICSMLIGDGCLLKKGVYQMNHGANQKDYALWKAELINNVFREKNLPKRCTTHSTKKVDKKTGKTYNGVNVTLQWAKYFKHLNKWTHKMVQGKRRKNIPYILSQCTKDVHTAIFLMDDGTETRRKAKKDNWTSVNGYLKPMYRLCTYSFTKGENELIGQWFKKMYDIDPYIAYDKPNNSCLTGRYFLRFSIPDTEKLFNIIKPYIKQFPIMRQKFWVSFAWYDNEAIILEKDNDIVQTTTPIGGSRN